MIHFSKHTQHFNDSDKELVSISTEGKTIEEIEIAFQKFLRACGFEIVIDEGEMKEQKTEMLDIDVQDILDLTHDFIHQNKKKHEGEESEQSSVYFGNVLGEE